MKFCRYCGKEVLDEAILCVNCGCSVNSGVLKKSKPKDVAPIEDNNTNIDVKKLLAYLFIGMSIAIMALTVTLYSLLIFETKIATISINSIGLVLAILGLIFAILTRKEKTIALAGSTLLPSLLIMVFILINLKNF